MGINYQTWGSNGDIIENSWLSPVFTNKLINHGDYCGSMDVNTRWCPGWIAKLVNITISTNIGIVGACNYS